jgi:hypothetical protein
MKWRFGSIAALAGLLVTASARADEPPKDEPPKDTPLAEQLFREGKQLMADGKVDEACPKFAESQRLDPSGGTLMNLARCHRAQKRWATAYAEYSDAYDAAKREQREERVKEAKAQLDELEPLVIHVLVVVPPEVAALPGFALTRNGVPLGPASWGTVQPVDPGAVSLDATATGYKPFHTEVVVDQPGASVNLSVPMLERAPIPTVPWRAPPPIAPPPATGMPATRIAGIVVTSTGALGMILGAVAGGIALDKQSKADAICPETVCPEEAVDLNGDAHIAATFANVGVFGGLAVTGVGVVLMIVNPKSSSVRASASGIAIDF